LGHQALGICCAAARHFAARHLVICCASFCGAVIGSFAARHFAARHWVIFCASLVIGHFAARHFAARHFAVRHFAVLSLGHLLCVIGSLIITRILIAPMANGQTNSTTTTTTTTTTIHPLTHSPTHSLS